MRVAIVLPAEHKALNMIVKGFKDTWQSLSGEESVIVFNALGEATSVTNILDVISKASDIAAVLPIGNLLTMQSAKQLADSPFPIVGMAAKVSSKDCGHKNICCIVDDVSPKHLLAKLRMVVPDAKKVTLVVASDEKMLSELPEFKEEAQKLDLDVQVITAENLISLTQNVTPQTIDSDSAAIVLLKDHLTVSQIPLLLNVVNELGILLITSDEGSVAEGAHFGVGVSEYQIGVDSAVATYDVLRHKKTTAEIDCQPIYKFSTFVNESWLRSLKESCGNLRYPIKPEILDNASSSTFV